MALDGKAISFDQDSAVISGTATPIYNQAVYDGKIYHVTPLISYLPSRFPIDELLN